MSNSSELVILITIAAFFLFWGVTQYLKMDMFGLGRWRAMREFPKEAKRLGLHHKSHLPREFGVYKGKYKGYAFTIDPDSNATIYLRMKPIYGLRLSTTTHRTNFDTGNPQFDHFFTERKAPPKIREKLSESTKLITFVSAFKVRWKGKYRFVKVVEDGIYFSFKYGSGNYIPASLLEKIMSDMVEIASLIQEAAIGR